MIFIPGLQTWILLLHMLVYYGYFFISRTSEYVWQGDKKADHKICLYFDKKYFVITYYLPSSKGKSKYIPAQQSLKYWWPKYPLPGGKSLSVLNVLSCCKLLGRQKSDNFLPVCTYKINGEVRHEGILIVGIWGFLELVLTFTFSSSELFN